jgi:transcriptional regulator with XRE-family HTH domain
MTEDRQACEFTDLRDLGTILRALRRWADLSQRELADRAGVPAGTVARIESGRAADPKFRTVERLVRAAGATLTVGGARATDRQAAGPRDDGRRDQAGRHYPAHLDVRAVLTAKDWSGAWWAYWYDLPRQRWPVQAPEWTYDLNRSRRDWRRRREEMRRQVTVRRARSDEPPNGWRFVAEGAGGAAVGELIAYQRRSKEDGGYEVVLADIEVLPQWRELGIGRRLVAELRAEMTRAGLTTASALVEDGVGQFLIKCGFTVGWQRPSRLTLRLPPQRSCSAGEGGRGGGERV